MTNNKIDFNNFNLEDFKEKALSQIKSGQSLMGKDGVLTPLIKQLLEAAAPSTCVIPARLNR